MVDFSLECIQFNRKHLNPSILNPPLKIVKYKYISFLSMSGRTKNN